MEKRESDKGCGIFIFIRHSLFTSLFTFIHSRKRIAMLLPAKKIVIYGSRCIKMDMVCICFYSYSQFSQCISNRWELCFSSSIVPFPDIFLFHKCFHVVCADAIFPHLFIILIVSFFLEVYNVELVLSGVMKQELEWDSYPLQYLQFSYKLFANYLPITYQLLTNTHQKLTNYLIKPCGP